MKEPWGSLARSLPRHLLKMRSNIRMILFELSKSKYFVIFQLTLCYPMNDRDLPRSLWSHLCPVHLRKIQVSTLSDGVWF